jgi:hypothetical protein
MGTSKTEKTTMDPLMQQFFGETYIPAIESFLERPYEAFTGERVAGLTPTTERLLGEAQMLQTPEEFAAAKGVVSGVAALTPEELSQRRGQYAQEYTDLILDPTRSRLMREQAIKRSQEAGEMTRALGGAGFGASRRGVMEGEREAARDVAIAELEADIARQGLDYGTQRLLSDVGVTTGAAGQLAQLGLSELGAETDILGRKMAAATIPQQIEQAQLDAVFDEYLRSQQYPLTQLSMLTGSAGALPQGYGTTTQRTGGLGPALGALGSLGMGAAGFGMFGPAAQLAALGGGLGN